MWKTDKKPMMTRQGQNNKRMRPRNAAGGVRRNPDASLKNKVFDSNGPGVRVKGTEHQVFEKYISYARDASTSDDRIIAENFYQHAEHYARLANEAQRLQAEETAAAEQPHQSQPQVQQAQPLSQPHQPQLQVQQPQHADAPQAASRQAVIPDKQPEAAEQPQQLSAENKAPTKSPRVSLGRRSTSRKPADTQSTSVTADAVPAEAPTPNKPTRKVHAKRTIVKSEDQPQESPEKAADESPKVSKRLIAS